MKHSWYRAGMVAVFAVGFIFSFFPAAQAQDAAALYKGKCSVCHAADGSGDTPAGKSMKVRDLRSADVQKQTDVQLADIITNGKDRMPAYKGKISDDQIKQLVGYIRELPGKK